jgi:DNA replication and repair protein RecF
VTQISSIKLYNFRNYAEAEINFSSQVTVIYGTNGSGKTNLLEAISLLTPGKGLRNAGLDEIAKNGAGEWAIISEAGGYKISTGLELGLSKRTVKIDNEKQRGANVLAEYVSAIWLTPQMDGIFLESNSDRRKFFDRIIYNFDPEHASRVAVYENATSERLRLLKNGSGDQIWLKTLEKRMAEYGVAIAAARNEVIGYLQDFLNAGETNFPKPIIEIRGKYEFLLHEYSALEVEQIFLSDLTEARGQDAANGRTAFGVHKTDFYVINAVKNLPAYLSSTGEQKALLLSIILGLARLLKARKNKTPIVLLDEVIAHLDENRRQELYDEIKNLGCQTFLTGTEKPVFEGISGAVFHRVDNSFITPCFA